MNEWAGGRRRALRFWDGTQRGSAWALIASGALIVGGWLSGCARSEGADEPLGRVRAQLTDVQARVLGFEQANDWSSSSGTLASSSTRSQGNTSLAVALGGWTVIDSVQLSTLANVRDTLSYDIYLPGTPTWGETRVVLVSPSLDMWWQELGSQPLTALTPGQFNSVTFPIPDQIVGALSGAYTDLTIKVIINAHVFPQPYLIDNVVLTNLGEPDPPPGTAEVSTFTLQVPAGVGARDTFVSATDRVSILSQAHAGAEGSTPAIASFGTATTYLQADAQAFANLFSVGPVQLDVKVRVHGSITAPLVGKQGVGTSDAPTVSGGETTGTPTSEAISWDVEWPPPGSHVLLGAAPSQAPVVTTLPPGSYGNFDVDSRNHVRLSTGTYHLLTFNTEPESQLHLDTSEGPILIYVKQGNRLDSKGAVFTAAGEPGQLLLSFAGTGDVYVQGSWQGTIVAPNARIQLERPSNPGIPGPAPGHQGAFFGEIVEIASGRPNAAGWRHRG